MAITSIKTGSSFTNLQKYNDFLGPNSAYIPSSFESIATTTISTPASTVNFTSISGAYKSLQIRAFMLSQTAVVDCSLRLNDLAGSNYAYHILSGNGSAASASNSYDESVIRLGKIDYVYGSEMIIDIHDYASTTKNKTVRTFAGYDANGSGVVGLYSGLCKTTSAITKISVRNDGESFAAGTVISLYGIK